MAKQPASEVKVRELIAARERVAAQIKSMSLPLNDSYYTKAVSSIERMQEQLNVQACEDQLVKAGFPSSWKANFILMEWNSPELFASIVCAAHGNGAQGALPRRAYSARRASRSRVLNALGAGFHASRQGTRRRSQRQVDGACIGQDRRQIH